MNTAVMVLEIQTYKDERQAEKAQAFYSLYGEQVNSVWGDKTVPVPVETPA